MIEGKIAKKLLFKSGRIIDPFTKKTFNGDILVENGKISKISDSISSRGKDYQVIDCKGLVVTHGFVIFTPILENLEGKIRKL